MILKNFRPDIVIGVGGYSAGPAVIGAWLMRSKIVIHEQNTLPGITNRILSGFANRIYLSFKDTKITSFLWRVPVKPEKVVVSGNPVRKKILDMIGSEKNYDPDNTEKRNLFTVLILGGSQGAHSINMAVLEAAGFLNEKEKYFFIHQTGTSDEEEVRKAYREKGIACEVKSFFDDMARKYNKADLIICRAGATTVAELAAAGKASVFVPYPFAADNHQVLNVSSLESAGAAEVILQKNLTGGKLAQRIEHYKANPEELRAMADKAKSIAMPDAAQTIVDGCYELLGSGQGA
jgi:UDP-N-acetylglucosamine--N-acetylmuramyl-(pentapeptide) pyrophosphoryl-undecaprenol N-acetylglucosamine transferase